MTDKAYAVPLHELLASVPREARLVIDDDDGMGTRFIPVGRYCNEAAEALRARLAQPEPEPVAWVDLQKEADEIVRGKTLWKRFIDGTPLANDIACWMADFAQQYTTPQPRQWQGLTDEEVKAAWLQLWYDLGNGKFVASDDPARHTTIMFAKEIEAMLKEKNA